MLRSVVRSRHYSYVDPFHLIRSVIPILGLILCLSTTQASESNRFTRGHTKLDQAAPFRRCLWVSRWDFQTPEDIKKICYNAASARFTDLLFQVRGEGTVFYKSAIEPWAGELTSGGPDGVGRNPGWDPLATTIREAHRYGLRVHAYMNVLPGWAHEMPPPTGSGQLFASHRSWFMMDAKGRRMKPNGFYAFIDPSLPEVRAYLARVFAEVAANYNIDGIHLDYIRYPNEKGDYSYHPTALSRFRDIFGCRPSRRPEEWAQFRRKQITLTVEAISKAVRRVNPNIELSASVIASQERGCNEAYQSALDWVRKGTLDAIAPMAYIDGMDKFDELCQPYREADVRKHVWMGIWADPERNSNLTPQIERAASMGFGAVSVFSYKELFPEHKTTRRAVGVYQAFVHNQKVVSQAH